MNKNKLKKNKINTKSGFTLVEAMVAIMILSISVAAMLQVTAAVASSARYANNQITANYLLQEAVDAVRNSRDTIVFQQPSGNWASFKNAYNSCTSNYGCYFSLESFDPSSPNSSIFSCTSASCEDTDYNSTFKYDNSGAHLFYTYNTDSTLTTMSNFKRKILITPIGSDELKVVATVEWKNGTSTKSQSLETHLLNWHY